MPLAGFSEEDVPLAIGYYLGLRWFQAAQVSHDNWEFKANRHGTTASCSCGAQAPISDLKEMAGWHDAHVATTSGIVLTGARGQWKPGVNQATCLMYEQPIMPPEQHPVPVRSCGCGYWAYWRLAGDNQVGQPHVAALIKGYGKVIKGPRGFRCEKAEIVGLVPPSDGTSQWAGVSPELLALALEEAYAPAEVHGSVAALLERYKAPDGQPALGDDWSDQERQHHEQRTWATGGWVTGGGANVTHHHPGVGGVAGSGSTFSFSSGSTFSFSSVSINQAGSAGVWQALGGSGGGGGYSSGGYVRAFPGGASPCVGCGVSVAQGQARCVTCEIEHLRGRLKPHVELTQGATTGVDALNQLHVRRESWAQTRGHHTRRALDYIKRTFRP